MHLHRRQAEEQARGRGEKREKKVNKAKKLREKRGERKEERESVEFERERESAHSPAHLRLEYSLLNSLNNCKLLNPEKIEGEWVLRVGLGHGIASKKAEQKAKAKWKKRRF
eukprot:603679-Amorphochlora_amoeboformis.AAC.1